MINQRIAHPQTIVLTNYEISKLMLRLSGDTNLQNFDNIRISKTDAKIVKAFVLRTIRANICYLQDQVDISCGEILRERVFEPDKLREHLEILLVVRSLGLTLTSNRIHLPIERQNLLIKLFGKLMGRNEEFWNGSWLEIQRVFDNIIDEIKLLQYNISEAYDKDFRRDIKCLLLKTVVPQLKTAYNKLGSVINEIDRLIENEI